MKPNILMPTMIFMTRYYNRSRHTNRIVSVSPQLFRILRLTLFALIVTVVSSCEKQVLKIGADILPKSDSVSLNFDTLNVFSYTMSDDSVSTNNLSISYLGSYLG